MPKPSLLIACAALTVVPMVAHAQDSPTLRQRGTDQPLTRQEAPSDTSQEATADERAALAAEDLPAPLRRVAPVYPPAALARHVQGTVLVRVTVRTDGSAEPPLVKRSVAGLDESALAAVSAWTWRPGRHAGKPAEMEAIVPVRFLLPPDANADWQAERGVAAALEKDGRTAEAFDRYALAVRAMRPGVAPESLDALRRAVIRTRPRGAPREGVRGDEPPVEAWIHLIRGDSLAAISTAATQRAAIAEYEQALTWAPWLTDWYLPLAQAAARLNRNADAARSLDLYLLGDVPAGERARLNQTLAKLRGGTPGR